MLIAHLSQSLELADASFVHAVALGLASGSPVTGVHVGEPTGPLPRATDLLRGWGRQAQALEHGWRVRASGGDPVDALLAVLDELRPGLVVTGTHPRSGLGRLFAGSVAEAVARNLCVPTLILPDDGPGLVDPRSGVIDVATLLLPVGNAEAQRTVDAAETIAKLAGAKHAQLILLHVSDGGRLPRPLTSPGFTSVLRLARGSLVSAAEACAREANPRLIVMSTRGRHSVRDVVLASHAERVLHGQRLPMLWVPLQPSRPAS